MEKNKEFYVVSDDGKWYAVNEYSFTDKKKDATKFSEQDADDVIHGITIMNLKKEAA